MALKSSREGLHKELVDYLGNLIINEKLKKDIYDSIDSFLKIDLLWTNADITSEFVGQSISLDLSKYKQVIVIFNVYKNNQEYTCTSLALINSKWINTIGYSGGTAFLRNYKAGTNVVTFANCESPIGSSVNNNYAIPYQIYGVR